MWLQTSGYQRREERGGGRILRVGEWEVQTISYKTSYKDIMYNTENIAIYS